MNKEPFFEKCNSTHMCTWLADRTEPAGFAGKGFVVVSTIQRGKQVLYGVKFKQARGDEGITINFCPFCGKTPGLHAATMEVWHGTRS